MDRKVVDVFNSIDVRHRFFQGDLLWTGYRTSLIPYVRQARTIGKSQYNFSKKLKNFLDALLDASYLPIRFISMAGFVTAGLGLLYAISIVITWLFGETPFTGWAPIMIVVLLVGGMIMVMLGIIGEYVWRINEEVRKRPNYVIRRTYPWSNVPVSVDGIKCYSPLVAESYDDYPDCGFELTEEVAEKSFWVRSRKRIFKHLVLSNRAKSSITRFLEIGCGTGDFVRALAGDPAFSITGSEVYAKGLVYAKASVPNVEFVQLDITRDRIRRRIRSHCGIRCDRTCRR